jgi:2-octaprenyl-6-methoxyphenol hydroxylase
MRQISNVHSFAASWSLAAIPRRSPGPANLVTPSLGHSQEPPVREAEALVTGAGIAGLAAALGFASKGFDTILVGAPERLAAGRTVALLDASVRFLSKLGAEDDLRRAGAPLRSLRIIDETGSLWRAPTIEFHASEIGLACFGWNIENVELVNGLAAQAGRRAHLALSASRIIGYDFGVESVLAHCEDGSKIKARLIVAADGRNSPTRAAAGLATRVRRLEQEALTTIVAHRRPHDECSTEFHTRSGPMTLVPLRTGEDGWHRSSLVWVMSRGEAARRVALDDRRLAAEIESRTQSIHGAVRIAGGRGAFALASQTVDRVTGPRLALIGDAAHVLPPIGAQGLNLGLRDAAWLIETSEATRRAGGDIGGPQSLARYEASRRRDVAVRARAIEALSFSLIADFAPIDLARSAGLAALGAIGPLRRLVMREGVAPLLATPASMRRQA